MACGHAKQDDAPESGRGADEPGRTDFGRDEHAGGERGEVAKVEDRGNPGAVSLRSV